MIKINKLPEPPGLKKYKSHKELSHSYEDGSDCFVDYQKTDDNNTGYFYQNVLKESAFDELRVQLLKEQKYVCCYCGQSLKLTNTELHKMKTEHFLPKKANKKTYPDDAEKWRKEQLTYSNLLGCCMGNSDKRGSVEVHCDSQKSDTPLLYIKNPAHSGFSAIFEYRILPNQEKITVHAKKGLPYEDEINEEIKQVLNLNEQLLAQKRYRYWKKEVEKPLSSNRDNHWKAKKMQEILNEYVSTPYKELPAFYDCIVNCLQSRIKRLPN